MINESDDVVPVRDGDELDWGRLDPWLRTHVGDLEGPLREKQFPGGHANLTYSLAFDNTELVLRRPPHGTIAPGAHDMAREYHVLSRLGLVYHRAPRALAFCEDLDIIGTPFVVLERRHGVIVRDRLPDEWAGIENAQHSASFAMVDAMAALHAVNPDDAGLGDLGRPEGFVERQLTGWHRRWHRAKGSSADFDKVHELLVERRPETRRHCIIHNDFKLDNCMYDHDRPDRVTTVLDWDMATLGDPMVELGALLSYWPKPGDPKSPSPTISLDMADFPSRTDVVERYRQSTGHGLDNVDWYLAFGSWRLAVVLQQMLTRYRSGESQDERYATFGDDIEQLIVDAIQTIDAAELRGRRGKTE